MIEWVIVDAVDDDRLRKFPRPIVEDSIAGGETCGDIWGYRIAIAGRRIGSGQDKDKTTVRAWGSVDADLFSCFVDGPRLEATLIDSIQEI